MPENTVLNCVMVVSSGLSIELYEEKGDTLLNSVGGDALVENTNNLGRGVATVTEALVGVKRCRVRNAANQTIGTYLTEALVDDTGIYYADLENIDGTGVTPITATAIRAALGMATADLDTQLDAILASTGSTGAGEFSVPLTIRLANNSLVPECDCVLTTSSGDPATDVYGAVRSNSSAVATFDLDAGVYYLWRQKAGFNFTNPKTVTVSSVGVATIT